MIWGYRYFRKHPYTPWKINGWNLKLMVKEDDVPDFKWVIFRFQPLIFRGVFLSCRFSSTHSCQFQPTVEKLGKLKLEKHKHPPSQKKGAVFQKVLSIKG